MTKRQRTVRILQLSALTVGLCATGARAQQPQPMQPMQQLQQLQQMQKNQPSAAPMLNALQTGIPDIDLFNRNAKPLDINAVPVLANIVKSGAKLFYLGERSGLHGWFIVKGNEIQMIYVTSDGQTALIGGMFTKDGEDVTGPQIAVVSENNKELADMMSAAAKQQQDVSKVGATPGGFAAVPVPAPGGSAPTTTAGVPAVTLSPGERLLQDLSAAAGVTLGKNLTAELLVVVDPNCPHCKETWREMRKPVMDNQMQVRLIPVANNMNPESARAAARLLQAPNPLEAWDKYVEGDKSALAGEADPLRAKAVSDNRALVDKWNINATPYIVYRAKDGRVKIVQGQPERMAAVLSDLLK